MGNARSGGVQRGLRSARYQPSGRKRAPVAAANALNLITELTLSEAVEQTPHKVGVLKGSAKVSQHATPRRLSTRITYGTDYALYVHESFARHYPPYGTGGNRKFLENAVNARARTFVADVAREMRREIQPGQRRLF